MTVGNTFPEIPENDDVPDIVRGVIDPFSVSPPSPLTEEQRRGLGITKRMIEVEDTYGTNHPYTRALRLWEGAKGQSKRRVAAANQQIRRIGQEHNFTSPFITGVLAQLMTIPVEP
jgi:hypothetical protein